MFLRSLERWFPGIPKMMGMLFLGIVNELQRKKKLKQVEQEYLSFCPHNNGLKGKPAFSPP